MQLVDVSHDICDGMVTYPGLPAPSVGTHLSREAAEEIYGPGITFQIGMIELCTNTGTYLDVPFHRYADGHDLTELALERVADVPAVCIDARGKKTIDLDPAALEGLTGHAVLIHTGHAQHWGTDAYFESHPYIPIVEHLRGLEALPTFGFQFSAVPPKIEGAGTFTVRAWARID